jgi:hypothetical protein
MPKICYSPKNFSAASLNIINKANAIIDEYEKAGYDLTLRQLYYQFVSRDLLPNKSSEYNRLGSIITDARLAGLVDWNSITDRTRYLRKNSHWDNPADIVESAARSYARDKWAVQPNHIEVWIEKDALVGVLAQVCSRLDVPYFSCHGYTSASEMWSAGQRLVRYITNGQQPVILHLGDHDPSGKDMSRDIQDRLTLFLKEDLGLFENEEPDFEFERLALNMDQVQQYNPPPNPAKITDSRSTSYIAEYGSSSWELDALDPSILTSLIETAILSFRDAGLWKKEIAKEKEERAELQKVATKWPGVQKYINRERL